MVKMYLLLKLIQVPWSIKTMLRFLSFHKAYTQTQNLSHFICPYFESQIYSVLYLSTGGPEVKASDCNAGDLGSIPGSGRSPGEGNDNPLQYYCLENPMDRGAW